MSRSAVLIVCVAGLSLLAAMRSPSAPQELPQGHPQTEQQLPPGHPSLGQAPAPEPSEIPEPRPEDVASVESVVTAYYDAISGPKGTRRDWDRVRSLFAPGARLITARPVGRDQNAPVVMTIEQFIQSNRGYFEAGGYFENELHRHVDAFGNVAHVFSTYGSKRRAEDPEYYSRGINSIQLLNDGQRWWIASIMWDFERAETNPIPEEFLPAEASP